MSPTPLTRRRIIMNMVKVVSLMLTGRKGTSCLNLLFKSMASGQVTAEDQMENTDADHVMEEDKKVKAPRRFDFLTYNQRHIAFRLAYLGTDYQGFAIQDPPHVTIESCLFEVLKRTKLIEDEHTCKYTRCGRTDKGVSALGQVIALQLRSNLLEGPGVIVPEGGRAHTRNGDKTKELPYMVILNRNLPKDIRVLDWTTVDESFSARFSCQHRTYKYFFPRGNMDIDAMRAAAQHFLGQHDFRNFCKMDIAGGVTNFTRTILSFEIDTMGTSPPTPCQMCVATVAGKAFLMHQVRCMMAILFLVGNKLEESSVIGQMLDLERCPRKPQYGMASPEPLMLFHCHFEGLKWLTGQREQEKVLAHFQQLWTQQSVKTVLIQQITDSIGSSLSPTPSSHLAPLVFSDHRLGTSSYKPILKRPTSDTFEERYESHLTKKRKKENLESSKESSEQNTPSM